METISQSDYSIYIDPTKAFIFSMHPYDTTIPVLTRIELNLQSSDLPHESVQVLQEEDFMERIIVLLQQPHRLLVFGPSDDKYTLFKVLQTQPQFSNLEKTVLVAPFEEQPAGAQLFSDDFFSINLPF